MGLKPLIREDIKASSGVVGIHQQIEKIYAELRIMGLQPDDFNLYHTILEDEVRELELRFTQVQEILPMQIFAIRDLTILRLSNIVQLPDEISQLTQLRLLEIRRLQSTEINPNICQLRYLEILIISQSAITRLPEELTKLAHLRDIDLIHNQMKKIPEIITQLPNLRYLSLAGFSEHVTSITDKLSRINHLEKLFLGKFKKPIFPEIWSGITSLVQLRNLTISGYSNMDRELIYVPPEINNLTQLESLWVDGAIMCFPDIPDLKKLNELFLFATALHSNRKSILKTRIGVCINPDCPLHNETRDLL